MNICDPNKAKTGMPAFHFNFGSVHDETLNDFYFF